MTAEAAYRQALAIHRDVGHRRYEGVVLCNLASHLQEQRRLAEAERSFEASLAILRETGQNRMEGGALAGFKTLREPEGWSGR